MIIHVVQTGETAESIANDYGISKDWLVVANGIVNPNIPVVGDTYIILYPKITHTVVEGDTLESVAETYDVTVLDLLRNNAQLSNRRELRAGESIVIAYSDEKQGTISITSIVLPQINRDTLRKTLPYLTYLSIYSYEVNLRGEIKEVDDKELIEIAKEYGVVPIMYLTFPPELISKEEKFTQNIFNNEALQRTFIFRIIEIIRTKGYLGLNFDTVYVHPGDRQLYLNLIERLTNTLQEEGLFVFTTLSPTSFDLVVGRSFSTFNYSFLSSFVDGTYLLPFEMKTLLGVPTGSIPFGNIYEILNYVNSMIPANYLSLGISTVGYIWEMPYIEGISQGRFVSNHNMVQLAREYGIAVQYDEYTQSSYFTFFENGLEFLVLYKDARSIQASLDLVTLFQLKSIIVWGIMEFFYDIWLIINSQYEIEKLL